MDFNFLEEYKNYSNSELLKIIKHPDAYQNAAVEAAKQILEVRDISEKDYEAATDVIKVGNAEFENMIIKNDLTEEGLIDFISPAYRSNDLFPALKWLNVFLIAIAIQYIWALYHTAKYFIRFLKCQSCTFGYYELMALADVALIFTIFVLLSKRNKWGWILLFGENLLALIFNLSRSYFFFKYLFLTHDNVYSFLGVILLKGFFSLFLWQNAIAQYYGVTRETKKKIAIIAVAFFLYAIVWANSSLIFAHLGGVRER